MDKCLRVGALDADEDREEIRFPHQPQQFVVVGHVDRGFGRELEWVIAGFQPGGKLRQERLERLLVADQVVVDEIHVPAIPKLIERFKFGEHLPRCLGARHAAVQFDDVTKFAGERTPARILHADVQIVLELEQIEARNRRQRHVDGEFRGDETPGPFAGIPGGDEFADDAFDLAEHPEIRGNVNMWAGRWVRPADDDRFAMSVTEGD